MGITMSNTVIKYKQEKTVASLDGDVLLVDQDYQSTLPIQHIEQTMVGKVMQAISTLIIR
jgi:hypothetical protein